MKKEELLKDEKFIKKMERYGELYCTLSSFDDRGLNSFYTVVYKTKMNITDTFGEFLNELDEELEEFRFKVENEMDVLKKFIQVHYELDDNTFEELFREIE